MFFKKFKTDGVEVCGQMLSLGGTKMEEGRTWGQSQDLMSRTIRLTNSSLEVGKLSHLKSFHVTSSHKNRTSSGSSTPRLMNAASCDLEPQESSEIRAVIYGGHLVDTGLTSDEIVVIKGKVIEDMSKATIDVTRYPACHKHYTEFNIPAGWPDGSHLVQLGEVPEGRTGSKLSHVRKCGSSDLLISVGGHSKPDYFSNYYHPQSSVNLLLVPEMRWWKLAQSDSLQRSFHCQTSNSDGDIFILGGMSMKQNRWSVIHPLNQVIKIHINEDFTYTETILNLHMNNVNPPFITNFTSCGDGKFMFVFSGFTYPKYDPVKENLYKFQPPKAKRNKLPKFSSFFKD